MININVIKMKMNRSRLISLKYRDQNKYSKSIWTKIIKIENIDILKIKIKIVPTCA